MYNGPFRTGSFMMSSMESGDPPALTITYFPEGPVSENLPGLIMPEHYDVEFSDSRIFEFRFRMTPAQFRVWSSAIAVETLAADLERKTYIEERAAGIAIDDARKALKGE